MKTYLGKTLILIGAIHTVFGIVFFHQQWLLWLKNGIWNTVNGQAESEWAFWFIAIGFLAMLLGWQTDWMEKHGLPMAPYFAWGLFLCSLIGVVLMPISGIWLIFLTSLVALFQPDHLQSAARKPERIS